MNNDDWSDEELEMQAILKRLTDMLNSNLNDVFYGANINDMPNNIVIRYNLVDDIDDEELDDYLYEEYKKLPLQSTNESEFFSHLLNGINSVDDFLRECEK